MNRVEKALAFINREGLGLEIGPSYSPIAPRRAGFDVQIVDYLDADALREKFKDLKVDTAHVDAIEDVDFVWKGEPLSELVGGTGRYDWIVASHVIEHIPDLVRFFHGCQDILKPDGVLSLIVPDKRFCFDYFRPLSTTGGVLDAFEQQRIRPTPGSVFDNTANCVTLDGEGSWSAGDGLGAFRTSYTFEEARDAWTSAKRGYEDAHLWCFSPASFRLILQDLRSLDLLRFGLIHEFDTAGNEFFATLGCKAHAPATIERTELLRQVDRELVEGSHVEVVACEPAGASVPTMSVTAKEERMIMLKRRVMEGIRRPFAS